MKVTVFTCVIGDTDSLKAPSVVNPSVRYVVFSDRAQNVPPYVTGAVETNGDPRLVARRLKILAEIADHPELLPDVILWHDAAFRLDCDPVSLAEHYLNESDVAFFRHPDRNRIQDEAVAIAKRGHAPLERLQRQVAAYTDAGFAQKSLSATGFCLRRVTPRVREFDRLWWAEVLKWSWRDQMSVDYALWKAGVQPTYLPGHYRENAFAKWHPW